MVYGICENLKFFEGFFLNVDGDENVYDYVYNGVRLGDLK